MFDNVTEVQNAPEVKQEAQPAPQESSKEQNLRYLRERAEAAERRAAELENQQKQREQAPQEDYGVNDDDYVEGKHLKKYVNSLKKEVTETRRALEEMSSKAMVNTAHLQLKSEYNDFDHVVSQDNLDKLARHKPSLYRSIMANQDIYDRGSTAYEMIRSAGFYDKEADDMNKRIEQNKSKPKSAATIAPQVSDSPLSGISEYDRRVLTKDRLKQLRESLDEAKKMR